MESLNVKNIYLKKGLFGNFINQLVVYSVF